MGASAGMVSLPSGDKMSTASHRQPRRFKRDQRARVFPAHNPRRVPRTVAQAKTSTRHIPQQVMLD